VVAVTATTLGWPDVAVALIAAAPALLAAILAYLNNRAIKTPSGDKIGSVVERTHDLAAVAAPSIQRTADAINGEAGPAPPSPPAADTPT
jgi:cobalamin synthase